MEAWSWIPWLVTRDSYSYLDTQERASKFRDSSHESRTTTLLVFMIMNGFPETQPEVENAEAAGQAARETTGNEIPQAGVHQQKWAVGPLRGPRQNNQQHAERGADGHKQQSAYPQQPYLPT